MEFTSFSIFGFCFKILVQFICAARYTQQRHPVTLPSGPEATLAATRTSRPYWPVWMGGHRALARYCTPARHLDGTVVLAWTRARRQRDDAHLTTLKRRRRDLKVAGELVNPGNGDGGTASYKNRPSRCYGAK